MSATKRYDNMRSKAEMSPLNLPHVTNKLKIGKKIKKVKTNMLKSIGNSPGNLWSQSQRIKGRLQWEELAEEETFEPGMKEPRGEINLTLKNYN